MSQEVYCIAITDNQAQEIIQKIKRMGIASDAFTVVANPEKVDCADHRASEEARSAANGASLGVIIGLLLGTAVLSTMGIDGILELFEAILFLACAALGGAMFGAIVGSTGPFAKKRTPNTLEHHFEEEIRHRGTMISVQVHNVTERDRLIGTMNDLGAADIHYSGEKAA